jgi:hypothetical protein
MDFYCYHPNQFHIFAGETSFYEKFNLKSATGFGLVLF